MTNAYGLRDARDASLLPDFVQAISSNDGRGLAVYDADGTLWVNDVADDFTQWMIAGGHIPGDAWPIYMRIYRDDPPTGCEYLLRFYEGMTRGELAGHVDRYWREEAARAWVWEVMESLYHLRDDKGYPIWICSGTPTDFLLPLKEIVGATEIVGMDFELDRHGRITGWPHGIPCAGLGKKKKLESLLGPSRQVTFCAGNGNLDGPMMELAKVAWSVYPDPDFARYSEARAWPILPRPADFVEEEKFLVEN
ncbi:MAG: haloacid dehalogenase-like hydrolase [Deltaproteobacteria bacterium]|nr:haloacid dehalogenase-like hydrolase [Deltaproteobacteria bacterium]